MKKLISTFISATLAAAMLAGCGGQSESAADSKPAVEAEEAEEETTEPAAEEAAEGQSNAAVQADMNNEIELDLSSMRLSFSGIASIPKLNILEDPSSAEIEELERMARDYTPPEDSPLVNNAENFYYYSQMNEDEQELYDAMMICASDPTTSDNVTISKLKKELSPLELEEEINTVYYGMLYDHPELFWMYSTGLYGGVECTMSVTTRKQSDSDPTYSVICKIQKPFEKFEERMEEFNNAVDAFMEDIDLSQSEDQIALQIHDKLIDIVDYNYGSIQERSETQTDISHTAYAALVKDSKGTPNCAVCDGYALAYVYLLQQAGIDATVILGEYGNGGGHAWSAVKLDGEWYEVDPTSNDAGNWEIWLDDNYESQLEKHKDEKQKVIDVIDAYRESLKDKDYRFKIEHELYNLTTTEMMKHSGSDYGDYFDYISSKGRVNLSITVEHYRANDERAVMFDELSKLMDLAPQATGTKYKLY